MNKQCWILFFLFSFVSSKGGTSLRFVSHPGVKNQISYELDFEVIKVDANIQNQILIKYMQRLRDKYESTLIFYCFVNELGDDDLINNAHLCRKLNTNSKEDCHTIKTSSSVKFGEGIKFDVTFDNKKGIEAVLRLNPKDESFKNRKEPYDGLYFCKLSNTIGAVKSNFIEFQDYEYYRTKIANLVKPLSIKYEPIENGNVNKNDLPVEYPCGQETGNIESDIPTWLDRSFLSPFVWIACNKVTSGFQCDTVAAQRPIDLNTLVDYYQHLSGKISIMSIKSGVSEMRLICLSHTTPTKTYVIHFGKKTESGWKSILIESSGTYNKKIKMMTPAENNVQVREGSYELNQFKLRAQFVANPDHNKRKIKWTKDGYSLPKDIVSTDYDVTFPNEITKSHSGKYVLNIKQSQLNDEKTITFNVEVVNVPRLKDPSKFSSIIYIMENQNASLEVSFESILIKKNIEVNSINLDLSSTENKARSLQNIKKSFPLLTGIQIDADIENNDKYDFKYTAKNLFENKGALQAKTHTVTFIAENRIGVSKASTLIRVFALPEYIHYPSSYNCTSNCRNVKEHIFRCSIKESVFESEGLKVQYHWFLNGENLNRMGKTHIQMIYMEVKGDTVKLKKLTTDDFTRDQKMVNLLQKAYLSCVVQITLPGDESSNPIYDSNSYSVLKPKLQAQINIQQELVAQGSPSWVIPVVVSLIILIIIIALILFFCLRGGETYNVDQKERAQGHDPEREIRETELFHAYERGQENDQVQGSKISLNDDDSVGVGSDDGELDVYDIDPGKFNEEGSFIGQYASDPRRNKTANGTKAVTANHAV